MIKCISIKNFGAIKYSYININPLTVFTGANSSGKSSVASIIHCLSSLKNISEFDPLKYFDDNSQILFTQLNQESIKHFNNSKEKFKIPTSQFNDLLNHGVFKYLSLIFEEIIMEEFDDSLNELINFKSDSFQLKWNKNSLRKQTDEPLKFEYDYGFDDDFVYLNSDLSTFYMNLCFEIFENLLSANSYYIPAERSEIIIDKKILSRRVKNESEISKKQGDVLSDIINIDSSKKGPFYDLGCRFDLEFSGIIINIEEKNFINDIVYREHHLDKKLSSKLLSTSIHEMTLFSLYLKYVLKKGDLLIIEEPEAHLHPENQRLLLKYIVNAVNQGLRIIITTHSEYISDQLNNLVRLNNVSSDKFKELGYDNYDIIKCEDLAIYNFKKDKNYEFITEKIEIDETCFIEENFSKIVDELYDETIEITNSSLR